jgi:hypothetical protein
MDKSLKYFDTNVLDNYELNKFDIAVFELSENIVSTVKKAV